MFTAGIGASAALLLLSRVHDRALSRLPSEALANLGRNIS
jgi:hypothetical protein